MELGYKISARAIDTWECNKLSEINKVVCYSNCWFGWKNLRFIQVKYPPFHVQIWKIGTNVFSVLLPSSVQKTNKKSVLLVYFWSNTERINLTP